MLRNNKKPKAASTTGAKKTPLQKSKPQRKSSLKNTTTARRLHTKVVKKTTTTSTKQHSIATSKLLLTNQNKRSFSTGVDGGELAEQSSSSEDSELDDAQMKIAVALSGDMRKRVMAHKMKKPTLEERMSNTSDLYHNKTLLEVGEDDVGIILPMKTDIQPQYALGQLGHEMQEGKDGYWLVRQTTLDALNFIDKHTNTVRMHRPRKPDTVYNIGVPNLGILFGHRGTSKSFTLHQAVDYATRRGDIVISVSGWDTIHDQDGLIAPSIIPQHEGMYDQILKSRRFLEKMCLEFGSQLKQIKLSLPQSHYEQYGSWATAEEGRFNAPADGIQTPEMYPFPQKGVIPRHMTDSPGETLYDLAAMGSWRSDLAGRVANDFLYEVKKQTQIPVFIAIDDINALVQKSDYMNPANLRTRLDATRLTFVRGLIDCVENPPQRGSTLIATSSRFTSHRVGSFLHRAGEHIRTTSYTVLEHQAMLEHYYTSKIIMTPMDIEFFRRSQIVTGAIPKAVREFASYQ